MAEIADVREANSRVTKRGRGSREAEAWGVGLERALSRETRDEQAAGDGHDRRRDHDRPPVRPGRDTDGPKQVRQCRAHRECPDQDPDREAATALEPAGDHAHADRVHEGERGSGQRTERKRSTRVPRNDGETQVGDARDDGPDQEQDAARYDVGRTRHGHQHRRGGEAQLDRDGQEGQVQAGGAPLRGEGRRHGRGTEPGRERQQHAARENRELAPARRGIGLGRGHSGSIVHVTQVPRRTSVPSVRRATQRSVVIGLSARAATTSTSAVTVSPTKTGAG